MKDEPWNNEKTEKAVTDLAFDYVHGDFAPHDLTGNEHYKVFMTRMELLLKEGAK